MGRRRRRSGRREGRGEKSGGVARAKVRLGETTTPPPRLINPRSVATEGSERRRWWWQRDNAHSATSRTHIKRKRHFRSRWSTCDHPYKHCFLLHRAEMNLEAGMKENARERNCARITRTTTMSIYIETYCCEQPE